MLPRALYELQRGGLEALHHLQAIRHYYLHWTGVAGAWLALPEKGTTKGQKGTIKST
jgi:hypothetical protein